MFFIKRERKDNVVAMKESIGRRLIAAGMSFIVSAYAFGAYVTDGLVLHYDAIDNAGVGVHSDSPTVWKDLTGNGHDLALPTSGLTVGADVMTFDHAFGSVAGEGVACLADEAGTTNLTLEVVFAASEDFDGADNSARSVAANPRISLYLRAVGSYGLVGGIYGNGGKRYFAGAPTRCCEWNNTQFIRRFHTYSLRTKALGGSVAVDGSDYATLQSSFYSAAASSTGSFTVGCGTEFYRIKSVRLYNRHLTAAEAARNAAVDEARFALKPPSDANGNANAFDDAAFYFRGARQALNSYLDNYEFANALYLGAANNPAGDTFTVGGARSNIAVETMDVPAPYSGRILKNRSVVHFIQPYITEDKSKASTSSITLTQPVAATNKASYTVMLRFKLESRIDPAENATWKIHLLQLGYGYSNQTGLDLQLCGPENNLYVKALHGTDVDEFKDMQNDASKTLKAGEWVDMALTVNGRENRLYYKTESGTWYEAVRDTDVALMKGQTELYKLALGGPINGNTVGTSVVSADSFCFRGWYQQVAVWDRALSREEVLNAFCDSCADGDEWRIGVANDMSLEFAGIGSADLTDVNDWKNMKGSLASADDTVSVNFELASALVAKARTFKFKTTSFSAGGTFDLLVNGRTVAADVEVVAGQSAGVTVPGSAFVSGANTLSVKRTDSNAGKMEIDCLSLLVAEGDVPPAAQIPGDPFSGAYRWYRHDGKAFRDVMRTMYPNASAHKWTVRGSADNFTVSEVPVACPHRGVDLADGNCVYFAQPSYTNDSGVIYGKGGCLSASVFPVSNTVGYAVFTRFKIDSFQNPTNCAAMVLGLGYDWTNSRGMGLTLLGADPDNLSLRVSGGRTNVSITDTLDGEPENRLAQGKWIDLAVVVSNSYCHVYVHVEGGGFQNLGRHYFGSGGAGTPGTSSGLHLGHTSGRSATGWSKDDNDKSYFRGWIHEAAVWPHPLSEKDVKAVFGFPKPDVFRIGVENGSSAEFAGNAGEVYAYPQNADFRAAPCVVGPEGGLTIEFDLEPEDVRNQILRIASTPVSDDSVFAVSVNGVQIVNYTESYVPFREFTVPSGGFAEIGVLSRFLRTGRNTLMVSRVDSADAAFEVDAISFGNRGERVYVRHSGYSIIVR